MISPNASAMAEPVGPSDVKYEQEEKEEKKVPRAAWLYLEMLGFIDMTD